MSKYIKAALASSVLVASVMGANVANAATANADARANILQEITVTKVVGTNLDFGTIITNGSAGNVVIGTNGVRGTCTLICSGTTDAADFNVTGSNSEAVTLTVPTTVSLAGPGTAMVATLSSTSLAALDGSGNGAFSVGGSLAVNATQADGAYIGTFTVTVEYP
ncbi:MAG: DUF4402 domain-containing protein [Parasphingorhabdus sp.]|uniref:DUF4402 domain-containing protein n=1 Tax=Parasphingorhabdus sp. TaxID=2709688 RepID=UPI0030013E56